MRITSPAAAGPFGASGKMALAVGNEDGKVYVLYTTKGKAGIEVFSEQ